MTEIQDLVFLEIRVPRLLKFMDLLAPLLPLLQQVLGISCASLCYVIVLAVGFYIGLNYLASPPPISVSMIYDEFTREPLHNGPSTDNDEQPMKPISDFQIDQSKMRDNFTVQLFCLGRLYQFHFLHLSQCLSLIHTIQVPGH